MIRLWISRDAALPIREQLSAQLLLGILSRKLAPGEKLPSVRDLARRLAIHGNTVLAVYRDLANRGWVTAKPGRGVFVRQFQWPTPDGGIDDLIRHWLSEAQALGYSLEDVQSALARHAQPSPARRLLVVDSDPELARVLAAELTAAYGQTVASGSYEEVASGDYVIASSGQAEHVARAMGAVPFHLIHLKAMQDVLAGQQRPPFPVLIGVVSRSPSIRAWAGTLLASLGFDTDSVLLRDPSEAGWPDGLSTCYIIATDVVSALAFPGRLQPFVFRLISEESLLEVSQLVTA